MKREEIISEIIKRFKLDKKTLSQLEDYEYDLIYETLDFIDSSAIEKAISEFINEDFEIKAIRTTFHK